MSAIIVTGAAGVIGRAVVARLAGRQQNLVLTDIDEVALQRVATDVASADAESPVQVRLVPGDVTMPGFAEDLVAAAVETFGSVAACVNGAGTERPVVTSTELTAEHMKFTYELNVFALVRLCGVVIEHLSRTRAQGRIINIASGAALGGAAYMTTYNSSKHAVLGATRCLAREFARQGIAVNAVCPGFVQSRMVDDILQQVAALSGADSDPRATIPAGRFADPDEIAAVVGFLALDAPLYMTGSALVIDGGLYA